METSRKGTGPLAGLKIIDLTHALAGPYCTMILCDLGASVLKVESSDGDLSRSVGPYVDGDTSSLSGYFQSVNRGKRSLVLDLKLPDGRNTFLNLVADADVVVENFSVGVMDRLGLSFEEMRERNRSLVYATLRGFGDPALGESPYATWPAMDIIVQAMAGPLSITGLEDGTPIKIGPGVADIFPGALLSTGILGAILQVRESGVGQHVDIAMFDAVLSLCERIVYQYSITGDVPQPEGNKHPLLSPFDVIRARDGWVAIAAPTPKRWRMLCDALGMAHLADDPRFATNLDRVAHRDELRAQLERWTNQRTRAEIVQELGGVVPIGPVNTAADILDDDHARSRDMLVDTQDEVGEPTGVVVAGQPLKFSASPVEVVPRAPTLDEHGAMIRQSGGRHAWDPDSRIR